MICANPECARDFEAHKHGQKYCGIVCQRRTLYVRYVAATGGKRKRPVTHRDMQVVIGDLPAWVMPRPHVTAKGRLVEFDQEIFCTEPLDITYMNGRTSTP